MARSQIMQLAKRDASRGVYRAILAPIRWAFYLVFGGLFAALLFDSARDESGPGRRVRSARKELQVNVGAAVWVCLPGLFSNIRPEWIFSALSIAAVCVAARRSYYLSGGAQFGGSIARAIKYGPWLIILIVAAFALPSVAVLALHLEGVLVLLATGAGALLLYISALIAANLVGRDGSRRDQVAALLRVAVGVTDAEVAGSLRYRACDGWLLRPAPAIARARLAADPAGVDATTAAVMGDHEIVLRGDELVIAPASLDTRERRAQLAQSGGLVIGQDRDGDALTMKLAPGVSPTQAERVQAYARTVLGPDAALTEWAPYEACAEARLLTADEARVRTRLAQVLKIQYPWLLAAEVTSTEDRINKIVLHRLPAGLGGVSRSERLAFWQDVILSLPTGTNGWTVEEDADGVVSMTWGPARQLPFPVVLRDQLPDCLAPESWHRLTLGLDEQGRHAGVDLTLGPHVLLAGPTGSGKTIALVALAAAQLTTGHGLAIIDPTKGGVDFNALEPYTSGFARTFEASVALIKAVYAEGQRRKQLLLDHGEVKWSDLSPEIRAAEGVQPFTLMIDELSSLLVEPEIPKSLSRDDPERAELEELAGYKSILKLYIGKIARELRFVGVHLALATQRPDASILGGELRSNLTSIVQLAKPGSPPSLDAIRMIFPGDSAAEAFETLRALDDGRSPGLGVMAGDGGGVAGVRIAYAPIREVREMLDSTGVPHGVPLAVEEPVRDGQFGQIIDSTADEADVIDLGELDLSAPASHPQQTAGAVPPPDLADLFDL